MTSLASAAFVVLAGGSGTRVGAGTNKVLLPLAGRAALSWSFLAAARSGVGTALLVARPQDLAPAAEVLAAQVPGLAIEVVPGGSTRHRSEAAGLAALAERIRSGRIELVAIHDGARPLVSPQLIERVYARAAEVGAAVPVTPAPGLLATEPGPGVNAPDLLVRVQTPQACRAEPLLAAYQAADRAEFEGTDTASTIEAFAGLSIGTVPGSVCNLKITYPADLALAERLLRQE